MTTGTRSTSTSSSPEPPSGEAFPEHAARTPARRASPIATTAAILGALLLLYPLSLPLAVHLFGSISPEQYNHASGGSGYLCVVSRTYQRMPGFQIRIDTAPHWVRTAYTPLLTLCELNPRCRDILHSWNQLWHVDIYHVPARG